MQKFHNLRGDTKVPHTFYQLAGTGRHRVVQLTPDLLQLARSEQAAALTAELGSRWNIVETSFVAGIGRSLIEEGVLIDWDTLQLTDRRRLPLGNRHCRGHDRFPARPLPDLR